MRKRLMLALTAALLGAMAAFWFVQATPGSGVTSTEIATGSLAPVNLNVKTGAWKTQLRTKGQTDLTVVENLVDVGGTFGWHSHPGPSLIVVKAHLVHPKLVDFGSVAVRLCGHNTKNASQTQY